MSVAISRKNQIYSRMIEELLGIRVPVTVEVVISTPNRAQIQPMAEEAEEEQEWEEWLIDDESGKNETY